MTTLSYTTQHRVWQQRLAKEARDAQRFHQFFPVSPHTSRLLRHPLSASLTPSNPNLLRDEPFHHSVSKHSIIAESTRTGFYRSDSLVSTRFRNSLSQSNWSTQPLFHYYGPAEVRGKYARPASLIELPASVETPRTENPLLSRPVTSGALVRKRTRHYSSTAVPGVQDKPQTAAVPRKDVRVHYSRAVPSSTPKLLNPTPQDDPPAAPVPNNDLSVPTPVSPTAEAEPCAVPATAGDPEIEAELEVESLADELQAIRPPTAATWKTTTSQRRYIDELEAMLREERKVLYRQKRVLAEARLEEELEQ